MRQALRECEQQRSPARIDLLFGKDGEKARSSSDGVSTHTEGRKTIKMRSVDFVMTTPLDCFPMISRSAGSAVVLDLARKRELEHLSADYLFRGSN